jgi:hypothetical protein
MGIGAKQVCNDAHVTPIRGQLTILAPQPELKIWHGFSASPRYDGIAVGNTMIMGEWSTVPDMNESNRVVDGFHLKSTAYALPRPRSNLSLHEIALSSAPPHDPLRQHPFMLVGATWPAVLPTLKQKGSPPVIFAPVA